MITFYGQSVAELRQEMRTSIEEYIEFCQEEGKEAEVPYSGKLMIQTSPEPHRQMALQAVRRRMTLNAYVEDVLEKATMATA